MRFPHNAKIFRGQFDIAPFAGVFFLLLIFLLFNSSFVFAPGVAIELPKAANLPGTEGPTVAVAVDAHGQYYFQNQLMDELRLKQDLLAAIANAREPLTLVLQPDQDVKYDVIVRLGLLAKDLGFRKAILGTRPPAQPRASPQVK
jgi:biopolymer transport protein ExbD